MNVNYQTQIQETVKIAVAKGKCVVVLKKAQGELHVSLNFLAAPLMSVWMQKYGCLSLCLVGGILISTGYVISAFTPDYSLLYFSFGFISGKATVLLTFC